MRTDTAVEDRQLVSVHPVPSGTFVRYPGDWPDRQKAGKRFQRHKAAELDGALLDAAVAKAAGIGAHVESFMTNPPTPLACWRLMEDGRVNFLAGPFSPSLQWFQGGPIIERERIDVFAVGLAWRAVCMEGKAMAADGPTPLIAAMRAYVASKLGEEVELP
jgi:Protein of unknown function (DUF2591)